ncbi:MAG: hypothetical protein HOV81_04050 [Kofleriaceae bacterium]|nr:hypothetical protein [Kofleriaceae bacterium]
MKWIALFAVPLLAACGDDPSATPDALVCGADEMVCGGTCEKTMTDEANCGGCGTQCTAQQACVSGSCVAANIHCARVREADPAAPDGTYVNPANNDAFYCDFTNGVMYDDLITAPYASTQADHTLLSGTALAADTTLQKAFIGLFNAAGGVRSAGTYTFGNCCVYAGPGAALLFDGKPLLPFGDGSPACESAGADKIYNYTLDGSTTGNVVAPPLPADYFATHPPSQGTMCTDNMNPGIFYRKRAGLM